MSGVINSASPDSGGDKTAPALSDPVLAAAERKLEEQLDADPENKQNYYKIVVAGMRAGLSGGPNSILASLRKSPDPIKDSARGAVSMVFILRKESKGVMPEKALVPAAMTLMLHALDFVNRSGLANVGTPELVRATRVFANEIFRCFRITPQMLSHASARVHAITQDPAAMAKINLKIGATQHPGAATPTPLPPGPAPEGA